MDKQHKQSARTNKQPKGLSRRDFLLGSASAMAYFAGLDSVIASQRNEKKVKIVIVGSGSAGISIANRLAKELPNGQIVIIDKKESHYYWPGLTLVAQGIWDKSEVLPGMNDEFLPKGPNISHIKKMVKTFDPDNQKVITDDGEAVTYDYLVVATGIEYHYESIEGMDVNAIGQKGLASVYHSPDKAEATWKTIEKYSKEGGNGYFTLPTMPIRCAGAPIKMTFLTLSHLKNNGGFDKANMNFYSSTGGVFGLPWYNNFIQERFKEDKVGMRFKTQLRSIDIEAQKATFVGEDEIATTVDYDLLHVVPPMRAPKPLRESPLAWQSGKFAKGGWLAVDAKTLQHLDYPEVFGCGDSNGTPLGKTAATIKMSVPIVISNLLSVINDEEPTASFNGYTSCPLITKIGAAMLVEFDYEKNIIPTYPIMNPQVDSWSGWIAKTQLLKPTYIKMIEGKV